MGYRHLCQEPIYFRQGRAFHIPRAYAEDALFSVEDDEGDGEGRMAEGGEHRRGGHNYYHGRDAEKFYRRMRLMTKFMNEGGEGWEAEYQAEIAKQERGEERCRKRQ